MSLLYKKSTNIPLFCVIQLIYLYILGQIKKTSSIAKKCCTPDNFDMFFGHIFFVILDILKIFCSNKHQIITNLLNYLDPIKS